MAAYTWNLSRERFFPDETMSLAYRVDGLKYIVWNDRREGESIILFWRDEMHSDIASRKCRGTVLSAGFVRRIDDEHIVCAGFSDSLKIGARPEDQAHLDEWLATLAPAPAAAPGP